MERKKGGRHMERKIISCVVVGILVLVLGSISWSQDQPKILKIGVATALSGVGASWGIPFRDAVLLDDGRIINVGGERYKIKLIQEDNKYAAKEGVTAINSLIAAEKVNFIAQMGAPPVLATIPITEENKVIMTGVAMVWPPTTKYAFRLIMMVRDIYPVTFHWLSKNRPELKRIAQLGRRYEAAQAAQKIGRELAPKYGMQMVYQEFYEPGTQDYYPYLTKIIRTNPDVLDVCLSFPADAGLIVKQARELGWKGPIFSVAGADPEDILKVAGEKAEGYMFFCPCEYDMSSQVATKAEHEFYKKYVAKYGYFRLGAGMWYDHVGIIIDAIQKAGSLDTDKVQKVMDSEVLQSVAGPTRFGIEEYGRRQLLVPMYATRIHKGKAETFARIEWKEWVKEAGYKLPGM